mgnify:CR=1 FL=1
MPSYAGPPVASRPGEVASTLRLLAYLALTIALVILDHRGGWLSQVRAQANVVTQPLWWLAGLPGRLTTRVQDDAATRAGLIEENRRLRNDMLVANARLARLQTRTLPPGTGFGVLRRGFDSGLRQVDLAAEVAHRVDLDLRRRHRHHDDRAAAQALAAQGHALRVVAG